MLKRIAAVAVIFGCTAIGWAILGETIHSRSKRSQTNLRGKVVSVWGSAQVQSPPSACYYRTTYQKVMTQKDGKSVEEKREVEESVDLPLESSGIQVALDLDHRRKGLLWYSTYRVGFTGDFTFRNTSSEPQRVRLMFPLPASEAVYDDLQLTADGRPLPLTHHDARASGWTDVPAGAVVTLRASYRSQGLDSWTYAFGKNVEQVRNFRLTMRTNFGAIDFPENTLAPVHKKPAGDGWELVWNYNNLVSGYSITMAMPEKLQPGPLAGEISFFAPVSLFFFFFVMLIITWIRGIDLNPLNYFFLAAAFFAFHLLLAYLVDHISIHVSFVISAAVSIFLVVSYLRVVVGMRFAALIAGGAQLIYLVLFSYAFFFKGFTGLTVTIGAILTLFVTMQITARAKLGASGVPPPVPASN